MGPNSPYERNVEPARPPQKVSRKNIEAQPAVKQMIRKGEALQTLKRKWQAEKLRRS